MRILMAQLDYILGNFEYNSRKQLDVIENYGNCVDMIVFTELALTGYYPKDYLQRPGFIDVQDEFFRKIRRATRDIKAAVIIGFADRNPFIGKPLYNSLAVFQKGEISLTYNKHLLCDYNIFNEPRHFESGNRPGIMTLGDKRVGFLICEDAWNEKEQPVYTVDPVSRLERESLDLIVSINASPSNIGKQMQRHAVIGNVARRCKAPVVYVNQVGGYDDIVFDGASFVVDSAGSVAYAMDSFAEGCGAIELKPYGVWASMGFGDKLTPYPRAIDDVELQYRQSILGTRDYMAKCGFKEAVVGLSGGIDSAAVAMIAAKAVGPENVTCIFMPNFPISSKESVEHAVMFCNNFGIKYIVEPISEAYQRWIKRYEEVHGKEPGDLTKENWQARERGKTLMAYSNDNPGSLVLATGNKSETATGYCTTFGDMCGGLNPIGDIFKTGVRAICYLHNEKHPDMKIPEIIITKAPSAELSPGQKDTDSLPPYEILDPILELYIEGHTMSEIDKERCKTLLAQTSTSVVGRVLRRVDRSEYKRQLSTVILRIRQVAFGDGRQFPITGQYVDEQFSLQMLGRCTSGIE